MSLISRRVTVAAFLLTAACGPQGTLEVRAYLDHLPLANLEIVALSYDAQGILDSLAQEAGEPRPEFRELEAELRAFERRDADSIVSLHSEWVEARRRVADLADSLSRVGPRSPGYAAAYARFRSAYNALSRDERALEQKMREDFGGDRALAARAAAAADSTRRWERTAFRDYATIVEGQQQVTIRTDSLGHARVMLPKGAWWLVARRSDPGNPFMEFAWNVPVVVSPLVPVATPVSGRNVSVRWRR
ncbi:MAG: hypothetical protein O7I93_14930 [Gemmatimonadetes bacterium]|nr:hypothetical protein [Gemmatimonadota bacterium]